MKSININNILKESYLDYSMSVIVSRAIPDIRDGLKPVHRRILYSMYKLNLFYKNKFKKSARVVGEVLGKYHPHGDNSVYNAIVRMVQKWTLRYPLLLGQGNFGSIESDSAAAMRYTEVKFSKISQEISFKKIKNIIKMKKNFDNTLKEPTFLPINFPNLLINGSYGIAVGMSTNMIPHNLNEIIDTINLYIKNPKIKKKKLFKYIKGPDFPTGGIIINNNYKYLYKGKGKITLIANYKILKNKNIILIKEIPYQVSKLNILEQITKNIKLNKIIGVKKIIDKTNRKGIKIYFYIKKKYDINICLNQLLKYSQLKINISINNLVLVNKKPKILNFKKIIFYFIKTQHFLYKKHINQKYNLYKKKLLIINNLLIVINNIKNIINLFKESKSKKELIKLLLLKYKLNEKVIPEILKIKLYKFTKFENNKILNNKKKILKKINVYKIILSNKNIRMKNISNILKKIKKKYGDKRKSKIFLKKKTFFNKIINTNKIVLLFFKTFIYKILLKNLNYYVKKIKKHIKKIIIINNDKYLLCFSKNGNFFWLNINNLKYNKKYSLLKYNINKNKIITYIKINNIKKYKYLLFFTKKGYIFKYKINLFLFFKKKKQNIKFNIKDIIFKVFLIKKKNIKFIIKINNKFYYKKIYFKKKRYYLYKKIQNILKIKNKYKYFLNINYKKNIINIININNIYNIINYNNKNIFFLKNIYKKKYLSIIDINFKLYSFKIKKILFNNNKKFLKIKNKILKVLLY